MSHYAKIDVQYNDVKTLTQALIQAGFKSSQIEVHDKPQTLFNYAGSEQSQRAHIIVRRKHLGQAQNDLGFFIDKTGAKSEMHMCDYCANRSTSAWTNAIAKKHANGTSWAKKLKQEYAAIKTMATFKRQGKRPVRTDDDEGRIRIYARG